MPTTAATPPDGESPSPEHPALGELAAAEAAVDAVVAASLWSLSDSALEHLLAGAHRLVAKASAARLAVVREVDGHDLPTRAGSTSPAAFPRHRLNVRHADGTRLTRLAADLDGPYQATGEALAAGTICPDRAETVARTLRALPKTLPADVRGRAELFLLDHARTMDPAELAALGKGLRAALADDPPDDDDPADRRRPRLTDTDHDTVEPRGELDPETAGLLRTALDPLSKPAPAPDGTLDPRTADRRRADAFADLLHRAVTAGTLPSSGGVRPHVTVTVDLHRLLGGTGPAPEDSWGVPLSQATLDRICCDADITRIVFGPDSVPLDLGRALRLVPGPLRKAVVARDHCCAFPGCDRPASWCEIHHVKHWTRDHGETKLDNLVLLCGHHHRAVHHHGWNVRIAPDGLPEFLPPAWIDPHRAPRRNPHRRRHADLLAGAFP